jgi:hypothetical protein
MTKRLVFRQKYGSDGLFIEPKPGIVNDERAKREMEERLNRLNFVAHFHYEDLFTPRVAGVTFDEKGNYNCGRCNKQDGEYSCLIIPIKVNLKAGSCKHYEIECASDREMDVSKIGHTAEQAMYGVAANGKGFGCHRCPFASKANEPDSVGRELYCGKGDFRVPWNACCELNGAKVVSEYEENNPVK